VGTVPYKVYVVVDPAFGERLTTLPAGVPVWIVDTPANTPVAHRLWRERKQDNHLTGITTFRIKGGASPAENLLRELPAIDLHHGPESAKPPYTEFEVFGTPLTAEVRLALVEYGFEEFSALADGFQAHRQAPAVEW
jgi:hypothetical protein